MSQLRWTLLILGGVFIAALVLWERLRPHQARGPENSSEREAPEPVVGAVPPQDFEVTPAAERAGEPWIADEPLEVPLHSEASWPETDVSAPLQDPLAELPAVRADEPHPLAAPAQPPEPIGTSADDAWDALEEGVGPVWILDAAGSDAVASEAALPEVSPSDAALPEVSPSDAAVPEVSPSDAAVPEVSPSDAAVPVLSAASDEAGPSAPGEPIVAPLSEATPRVEWPPESERQILALRLAAPPQRFAGRAVRLALAAEGFRLGRFDIFHKPDEHGRALISVASLTRPGTFDLKAMDSHRYAGLNLFAVLPGPLPAPQTFDALLTAADNLNERLEGEVQDESGERLTDERVAELRAALPGGAAGALP